METVQNISFRGMLFATLVAATSLLSGELVLASVKPADDPAALQAPDEVIRYATRNILAAIEEAKQYYDQEPERFHAEIERVLFPIVDFTSFARGVMGQWGSRRYEASLADDTARQEFQSQVERFTEKFQAGLVATYAKGLLSYNAERVEVQALSDQAKENTSVIVSQKVYSSKDQPVQIRYKMRRNDAGEWKVRNVQLESVNLGKVYRNQFAAAVEQHDGNVDAVIDNWVVESQDVEPQ